MTALPAPFAAAQGRLGARLSAVALVLVSACSDRSPDVDADLVRDLQLATAQATASSPQLEDGPLDAPEPRTTAPAAARPQRTPSRTNPAAGPTRQPAPVAQRQAPAPRPVVEQPAPESEQQSTPARFRGIRAGASFGLTTRTPVCTSNLPGDKLVATVSSAVIGEDGAVIPPGSSVVMEVASVTPGDTPESAQITLRIRSILVGEDVLSAQGDVSIASELERGPAVASGSDKKKVIGGAIAGAVIGQIMGRDTRSTVIGAATGAAAGTAAAAATRKYHACLPAGATVRVTTTQPIVL